MKPEFLPYRYESLKHVSEILEDAKNIGWRKCRKYIRWEAVHVEKSDRALLKEAGDDLVENEELDYEHIGRLYEIWLNAAKYNRKTQELNRTPKVRKEYESLDNQVRLAKEYPDYVYQQIKDLVVLEDIVNLGNEEAQAVFYLHCVTDFVITLRSGWQEEFSWPNFFSVGGDAAKEKVVFEWFSNLYDEVGLERPQSGSLQLIIGAVLKDLGFEGPFFKDSGHVYQPSAEGIRPEYTKVTYESGSGDYLMRSISEGGHQIIKINQDHLFIQKIEGNPEAKKAIELFAQAYFKAREGTNIDDNKFEDFNNLLALKLKSIVRDQ